MVIQRIQTLWLFIAALLAGISLVSPVAYSASSPESTFLNPVALVAGIAATALLLIDIFLFRNLRRQKMVASVAALLIVCVIICEGVALFRHGMADLEFAWSGAVAMQALAAVMTLLARRGMSHDQRVLSNYDRIR